VLEPDAVSERDFLVVDRVTKRFPLKGGRDIQALRSVSFAQARGETLGIVGESGSGKSTLGRIILQLISPSSGEVRFDGVALDKLSAAALRQKRRDMQMVFQDPQASLDPRMRIERLLEEPLVIHGGGTAAERRARVRQLLDLVGLPQEAARRFPHEFSGGQRQRIAIARAIALSPALIVADEPLSALDVSIQAQILNLLIDLRRRLGLTYVFISHDLAVIRHMSDTVAVIYFGEIVEYAAADDLFERPAHPYTRSLLLAIPDIGRRAEGDAPTLAGEMPSPDAPPPGCAFHPRCPAALPRCKIEAPPERDIGAPGRPHRVQCWLYA
jgi:peptide/nickel transport system ATP-binding protein/oligopeptide transport system ATP-binding protein